MAQRAEGRGWKVARSQPPTRLRLNSGSDFRIEAGLLKPERIWRIWPHRHERDRGCSDFAGLHRMAAAELRHALPDCGCLGGPDGGRAHQLVQLGTEPRLLAFHE